MNIDDMIDYFNQKINQEDQIFYPVPKGTIKFIVKGAHYKGDIPIVFGNIIPSGKYFEEDIRNTYSYIVKNETHH